MLDASVAGLERKFGLFNRSDIAVPVGAAQNGNSWPRCPQVLSRLSCSFGPMSALADVSHFRVVSWAARRGRFGCSGRVHEPRGDPEPVWSAWRHRLGGGGLAGGIDHRRHADDAVHRRRSAARAGARRAQGHRASAERGRSRLRPLAPHPRWAQPAMEGGQLRRLAGRPPGAPRSPRARRHVPFCDGCGTGGHSRATAERLEGLRRRHANRSGRSLAPRDRAFSLGVEVAALTHGHPSGYLAAGFMPP